MSIKLTPQEQSIVKHLSGKTQASWEELAQFAKDPQNVKLRTLQKVVSDLKKKYTDAKVPCPIGSVQLMPLEKLKDQAIGSTPVRVPMSEVYKKLGDPSTWEADALAHNDRMNAKPLVKEHPAMIDLFSNETYDQVLDMIKDRTVQPAAPQNLVRLYPSGQAAKHPSKPVLVAPAAPTTPPVDTSELPAHRDFKLDKTTRRVKTKNGSHELRDQEWEIFTHLWKNAEKMVTLDDLRNLIWKNWGSKTPPSWADSISRSLTALRKTIPELKYQGRLLTITGQTTAYMLR